MLNAESLSYFIWDTKYRYRENGDIIDHTLADTWRRVAKAIASAEKKEARAYWESIFYNILEDFKFLPGGRILAGAGTAHQVTLFNCFVMSIEEDSLTSIFKALGEGALSLQQGGGIGYDFSILRPQGDLAKKTGVTASGPVSFMRIWDAMCKVLLTTGARRGAMMAVLRCDHPDIEAFIAAKADPNELRHFNVSVMVSDEFMKAVKKDAEWPLVFPVDDKTTISSTEILYRPYGKQRESVPCRIYRTIKARTLWQKLMQSAYHYAEPGVLFEDTINRFNNLNYAEYIHATNPCGEIPLPDYGACNLGAINLTAFIQSPFSNQASIKWTMLEETVRAAVRFQDNVIDVSHYPLEKQRQQSLHTRRIGLGITGLADTFIMLGMRYGSMESIALASKIMKRIATISWETSIELAKEKGAFPLFKEDYTRGLFVKTLPSHLQENLKKFGIRNSHHNTIAPTGTISLLANILSSGIEPIFQAQYDRIIRSENNNSLIYKVKNYSLALWENQHGQGLPPAFVDSQSLKPEDHLLIQAAIQPYIDHAISKTINLPAQFPFELVENIYRQAYELGLKGCTIFRPNPITGSVLQGSTSNETCCERET